MTTTPTKNESLPEFGDYVEIEQKRFGAPNEMYCYKVIGTLESNCWTDVPVISGMGAVPHNSIEPVVAAICCGVVEEKVERFRMSDVKLTKRRSPALTREAPTEGVGDCNCDSGRGAEHCVVHAPAPQRMAQGDRPSNCRMALRDAGKAYPRSGCTVCGDGGLRGCPYERTTQPPHQDRGEVEQILCDVWNAGHSGHPVDFKAITAALGAWVVHEGFFDPDAMDHLRSNVIDPVGVLRRKSNGISTVAIYTLRQEKPDVLP